MVRKLSSFNVGHHDAQFRPISVRHTTDKAPSTAYDNTTVSAYSFAAWRNAGYDELVRVVFPNFTLGLF